jgi:hypothetical protein
VRFGYIFLLIVAPLIVASDDGQAGVIKIFLDDAKVGTEFSAHIYAATPKGDAATFLQSLKGCKKKLVEPLNTGAVGIQWRCSDQPKSRAAVIYIKNGKVLRVLPSTVTRATITTSAPIEGKSN